MAWGELIRAVGVAVDASLPTNDVAEAMTSGDPVLDRADTVELMMDAVAGDEPIEELVDRTARRLQGDPD